MSDASVIAQKRSSDGPASRSGAFSAGVVKVRPVRLVDALVEGGVGRKPSGPVLAHRHRQRRPAGS